MNEIELLEELGKYYFQFGVFDEDGIKTVDVRVINTDDTTSTFNMKIKDIMFFTEYGTIKLPGYHILEKILNYTRILLNNDLDILFTKILKEEIKTANQINNEMNKIKLKIDNYILGCVNTTIVENSRVDKILKEKVNNENKYLYDLKELSKYIKCKLLKS